MEVDHGDVDIGVSEQILGRADVGAGFDKVGRERMAHRMGGGALRDAGFADRLAKLPGLGIIVQVVAGEISGPEMRAQRCGRVVPLPCPFAAGIRGFPPEGVLTGTTGWILEVLFPGSLQMLLEAGFHLRCGDSAELAGSRGGGLARTGRFSRAIVRWVGSRS